MSGWYPPEILGMQQVGKENCAHPRYLVTEEVFLDEEFPYLYRLDSSERYEPTHPKKAAACISSLGRPSDRDIGAIRLNADPAVLGNGRTTGILQHSQHLIRETAALETMSPGKPGDRVGRQDSEDDHGDDQFSEGKTPLKRQGTHFSCFHEKRFPGMALAAGGQRRIQRGS